MLRPLAALTGLLALASCSPATLDPPMQRSCRGEYVDACRPYAWSHISAASLTPNMIMPDSPTAMAHVHVDFASCAMAPTGVTVQIAAFIGGTSDATITNPLDGGSSTNARTIQLGMVGPAMPGATSIDTMIPNPFFGYSLPYDTSIQLLFVPLVDDCDGDLISIPYRTGLGP
jgi:hypothetical protein